MTESSKIDPSTHRNPYFFFWPLVHFELQARGTFYSKTSNGMWNWFWFLRSISTGSPKTMLFPPQLAWQTWKMKRRTLDDGKWQAFLGRKSNHPLMSMILWIKVSIQNFFMSLRYHEKENFVQHSWQRQTWTELGQQKHKDHRLNDQSGCEIYVWGCNNSEVSFWAD